MRTARCGRPRKAWPCTQNASPPMVAGRPCAPPVPEHPDRPWIIVFDAWEVGWNGRQKCADYGLGTSCGSMLLMARRWRIAGIRCHFHIAKRPIPALDRLHAPSTKGRSRWFRADATQPKVERGSSSTAWMLSAAALRRMLSPLLASPGFSLVPLLTIADSIAWHGLLPDGTARDQWVRP
jgi:hypothetical protein